MRKILLAILTLALLVPAVSACPVAGAAAFGYGYHAAAFAVPFQPVTYTYSLPAAPPAQPVLAAPPPPVYTAPAAVYTAPPAILLEQPSVYFNTVGYGGGAYYGSGFYHRHNNGVSAAQAAAIARAAARDAVRAAKAPPVHFRRR